MYDVLEEAKGFTKYTTVKPNQEEPLTGHGIILDIVPMTAAQLSWFVNHEDKNMYHIMTDFGNIVKLTYTELSTHYVPCFVEDDPVGRFQRQQYLLQESFNMYLKDLEESNDV